MNTNHTHILMKDSKLQISIILVKPGGGGTDPSTNSHIRLVEERVYVHLQLVPGGS